MVSKIFVFILINICLVFADELKQPSEKPGSYIAFYFGTGNYSPKINISGNSKSYAESVLDFYYQGEENTGLAFKLGSIITTEKFRAFCDGDIYKSVENQHQNIYLIPSWFANWKYFGLSTGFLYTLSFSEQCSDGTVFGSNLDPMFSIRTGFINKLYLSFSLSNDILFYSKTAGINFRNNSTYFFIGSFWEKDNLNMLLKMEYIFLKSYGFRVQVHKIFDVNNFGARFGLGVYW